MATNAVAPPPAGFQIEDHSAAANLFPGGEAAQGVIAGAVGLLEALGRPVEAIKHPLMLLSPEWWTQQAGKDAGPVIPLVMLGMGLGPSEDTMEVQQATAPLLQMTAPAAARAVQAAVQAGFAYTNSLAQYDVSPTTAAEVLLADLRANVIPAAAAAGGMALWTPDLRHVMDGAGASLFMGADQAQPAPEQGVIGETDGGPEPMGQQQPSTTRKGARVAEIYPQAVQYVEGHQPGPLSKQELVHALGVNVLQASWLLQEMGRHGLLDEVPGQRYAYEIPGSNE